MRGALHDFQPLLALQGLAALAIQAQYHRVLCADNLQGWRLHPGQSRPGQIGSPASADHCPYHRRSLGGGHQRRRRTGTGAEQTDGQRTQLAIPADPVDHIDQPSGQQGNIEAQLPAEIIQALLRFRQQVEQQRRQAPTGQDIGHILIARAQAPTAAAVDEDDQGVRVRRQTQIGRQFNARQLQGSELNFRHRDVPSGRRSTVPSPRPVA
ncbi:hypothetical protein D3C84_861970 [compost metagenome]